MESEVTPVYFHDCPALGAHTRLPRSLMADSNNEYILFYRHKCPFCDAVGGDPEYAPGVTPTRNGYDVDTRIAERLHSE